MDDTSNFKDCLEEILRYNSDVPRWKRMEEAFLGFSLILNKGNRTATAKYVGISIRTLRNKINSSSQLQTVVSRLDVKSNFSEIEEEVYETFVQEASKGVIRQTLLEIDEATMVFHIRGLFNLRRVVFRNEDVRDKVFKRLDQFDKQICHLTRTSAEDLREDIEIFVENDCRVEEAEVKQKVRKILKPAGCHPGQPEWSRGKCLACHQKEQVTKARNEREDPFSHLFLI